MSALEPKVTTCLTLILVSWRRCRIDREWRRRSSRFVWPVRFAVGRTIVVVDQFGSRARRRHPRPLRQRRYETRINVRPIVAFCSEADIFFLQAARSKALPWNALYLWLCHRRLSLHRPYFTRNVCSTAFSPLRGSVPESLRFGILAPQGLNSGEPSYDCNLDALVPSAIRSTVSTAAWRIASCHFNFAYRSC